jgi:hypothetical protein
MQHRLATAADGFRRHIAQAAVAIRERAHQHRQG